MISVSDAQHEVLGSIIKVKKKKIPLLDSLGMVLAEDIISYDDIPIYDNSAMDGYAVRAGDVIGADYNYPVRLKLAEEDIPAGKVPSARLEPGCCMSIMTGAPIPEGCSGVVMKEHAEIENGSVLIFRECSEGENIRYRGEDIKSGDTVLKRGRRIYPADIGVMASIRIAEVLVVCPPTVGIISTGDELLETGDELVIGKVRDSNSYSLAAQVKESGASYIRYGIVKDEKRTLEEKISKALLECDILLISGGVSAGDYDYVKDVLADIEAKLIFWRVNQKPGKPLAFLKYKDKFIFGLPGNPVSVMVCFEMYVRPLMRKMMGFKKLFRDLVLAKAAHDFKHKIGRTDFVRVIIEKKNGEYSFKSTGMQGSGILTSMVKANAIAVFTEGVGDIDRGGMAEVHLLKEL